MHVDVDAAEIGKNVRGARAGRRRRAARAGGDRRRARGAATRPARLSEWWARIDGWRAAHPPRAAEHADGAIDPEAALDALQAATGGEAIVTTDVGQHQMWAANRLRFERPRRWLTSGGLGTMGFGLPAALGAQVGASRTRRSSA